MAELENLDIKFGAKKSDVPALESDTLVFVRENAVTITASRTLTLDDAEQFIVADSTSNIAITIPTNAVVPFPVGTEMAILRKGTGYVTVATATGVTFNGVSGVKQLEGLWCKAVLRKIGTDEWTVSFIKAELLFLAGTQTIAAGDWSSNTATKTITGLTNNDILKVAPVSKTDATNWAAANIWVTHSGSTVTFAADTAPSASIAVVYEITRGIL